MSAGSKGCSKDLLKSKEVGFASLFMFPLSFIVHALESVLSLAEHREGDGLWWGLQQIS